MFLQEDLVRSIVYFSSVLTVCFICGRISYWVQNHSIYKRSMFKHIIVSDILIYILIGLISRHFYLQNQLQTIHDVQIQKLIAQLSLTLVLIKSGITLSFQHKLLQIIKLLLFPFLVELTIISILMLVLFNFDYKLALAAGCLLVPSGPAVIFEIQQHFIDEFKKAEQNSDIQQTIITSCSLENILSIILFSTLYNFYLIESDNIVLLLLVQCMQILVGIIAGYMSSFVGYLFRQTNTKLLLLVIITISFSVFIMINQYVVYKNIKFSFIISLSYFANKIIQNENGKEDPLILSKGLLENLNKIMVFTKIGIFGGLGCIVDYSLLTYSNLLISLLITLLALSFRFVTSFLINMNYRQKYQSLYVAINWLPKGTIQAALGSIVLDNGYQHRNMQMIQQGIIVYTNCLIMIFVSILIGSICGFWIGNLMLNRIIANKKVELSITNHETSSSNITELFNPYK